jgi:pyruvate carboxylase
VAFRFLHEDAWERLRALRKAIPNVCFQVGSERFGAV